MPFSLEAEAGLLSALFHGGEDLLAKTRRLLEPAAFYREQHREVYEAMLALNEANLALDPVLLTQRLRDAGRLDQVGGPSAIMELFAFMVLPGQAAEYLRLVRERWLMRQAIAAHAESIDALRQTALAEAADNVTETILAGSERIFDVCQVMAGGSSAENSTKTARQGVAEWVDHLTMVIENRNKGGVLGLATGLLELDQALHGLDDQQGEITVVAGRPGQGKTAMGCSMVAHWVIDQQYPGLVFSAEMTSHQFYTRLILGRAGIDTSKALTGHFSRAEQEQIGVWTRKFQAAPLLVNASSYMTTADLRTEVQIAKRTLGIRWILVDHLHLIKATGDAAKKDERLRLVEVMETLQYLKKQYHLAVVLLVQMSRENDRNAGKPPVLADLSGSAAIEQFADHVVFIHREPYFRAWHTLKEETQDRWRDTVEPRRERNPQCWSDGGKYDDAQGGWARQDYEEDALLFVRKNRRGPTPDLRVRYQSELTLFSSRMPKMQSNHPLDLQMGSYLEGRAYAPPVKATAHNRPAKSALGPREDAEMEGIFGENET